MKRTKILLLLNLLFSFIFQNFILGQEIIKGGIISSGFSISTDNLYILTHIVGQPVSGISKDTSYFIITDVKDRDVSYLPTKFILSKNYPNPFNPSTTIEFHIPKFSPVTVNIYNITGQLVKELIDQQFPRGIYTVVWDGTDATGAQASSGIYLYKITVGNYISTKKMLLIK